MKDRIARALPKSLYAVARQTYRLTRQAQQLYFGYAVWRAEERSIRSRTQDEQCEEKWTALRSLLVHAAEKIPLYHDKLRAAAVEPGDVCRPEDLLKIPPLTKDEIRANFPDRLLDSSRRLQPNWMGQTSGSTGDSIHFMPAGRSWRRSLYYAVYLRTKQVTNAPIWVLSTPVCTSNSCSLHVEDDPLDRRVDGILRRIPPARHLRGMIGLPVYGGNILCATEEYLENVAASLAATRRCILLADPVYLATVARYLRAVGRTLSSVDFIISSYELLTPSLRDVIEAVFGCPIYIQYGASELSDIANECEAGRLHLRLTSFVEVVRDGRRAAPGEKGRVVVTDLMNYRMPFIRYDIGDVAVAGEGECECGRRSEWLEAIHGRVTDLIRTADGRLLSALEADRIFRGVPDVAAYRLVQKEKARYAISVLPTRGCTQVDEEVVRAGCNAVLGDDANVRVNYCREIPFQSSRKFRFVYSETGDATL